MSLLIGGAQLAGYLRGQAGPLLMWNASIIENAVNEASKWKHKWNADYLESTLRACAFITRVSSRPLGMSLPRTSWVRLNLLRTGVGRFRSSMYKWSPTSSPNCECGATEQTADHVISSCLIHHVPRGIRGLQVLDDATRCLLNTTTASI